MLLILPMPMIWTLRIGTSRKLAVLCIFVCGYSIVVVSLGRLIALAQNPHLADDLTFEVITAIYWQAAEGPMTLMCVCLPAMLSLARKAIALRKGRASSAGSSGKASSGWTRSGKTGDSDRNTGALSSAPGTQAVAGDEENFFAWFRKHHRASLRRGDYHDANIHIQKDAYVSRKASTG
ncbi:hypothetical protein BCR34DRAFT_615696 [Clohesyomyces aquaticus]|uniref:Rhodopsin domain-containing protein n=1 Tax=Clohesyomyces aquaticus TaxID=1231657 RepID=A0A1Y1ZHB5_9PLEO|nr:hypothetical protein BCR34DRAFT_615696 [Clohesyomyces aquaticus]